MNLCVGIDSDGALCVCVCVRGGGWIKEIMEGCELRGLHGGRGND